MNTAFVTGGSGFVGRALIAALREKDVKVRALARSEAARATVAELGAEPVTGDLDDTSSMREGMTGCDVVFHSAAYVKIWGPREDYFRANVAGTTNVIDQAKAAGVKTLVHVSTEAVLAGERPIVQVDETSPRAEHPAGLYPLTKGLAEELVIAANSPALRTVIARPRLIWGKGDTVLLPIFVQMVKDGLFRWLDGGRFLTSTCHVRNVCEGLILAAERGRGGEIYFLTDGSPIIFRDFLTAMLKTQGVTPPNGSVPSWLARGIARALESIWDPLGLPGEPPLTYTAVKLMGEEVTVIDAKARRELGYVGHVSREEGLRELAAEG